MVRDQKRKTPGTQVNMRVRANEVNAEKPTANA